MTVTKFFITIIFFNMAGEPYYEDGWYPLEVPTLERCEAGAENVREYLALITKDGKLEGISGFDVTCDIQQAQEIKFS